MAAVMLPGWQTEELEEEWVDYEEDEDASAPNESLTQKLPKPLEHAHSNTATSVSTINIAAGTVVVRPEAPLEGGRLPLAHRMGLSNKNIFTPTKLKLETMFQSPSPPQPTAVEPGQHAQESTPAPNLKRPFRFCDDKSNNSFPFTFIQPCSNNPVLTRPADDGHQHDTQSKLRLFQFQYDTYTRDHLSAIIDAIPISASSRSHSSSTTPSNHYARKADIDSPAFRPPKRIKIAPDDEEILTKQVKPRAKRKSFPLARFDHVQETKPARLTSGVSDGIFRSVASSTVNASASLRSFDDELVVELQNVSIVQTERRVGSGSTALTNHTKGTTRVASSATQVSQSQSPQMQRRLPSSGTAITCIAPTDISPVPEQVGRMQFDRTQYKWVKRPGEESDDPFRDFESVVDYVSSLQNGDQREHPTIVINDAAQAIATDLSEEEIVSAAHNSEDEISVDHSAMPGSHLQVNAANLQGPQHTPLGTPRLAAKTMPTPIRSALKNPVATMVTPIHADPGSATGKLRSVSFSDGRHSGRIRGLHPGQVEEESSKDDVSHSQSKRSIQPSFRTKRIVDMLDELDDESSSQEDEDLTPCKSSSQQRSLVGSLLSSSLSNPSGVSLHSNQIRSFSLPLKRPSSRLGPNATFLTECSFGVAHDRLLQCITDVAPFEPHWEELTSIDLSGKALDSVARLKEFMPKLEDLIMNDNVVSWLSGVPSSVRLLSAVSNQLTGLTSYVHLTHLESLDISKNQIDSLLQLECLHRLRELKAEHNQITSLGGLEKLSSLRRLSLIGNRLTHADLSQVTWDEMEYLDLSQNTLETVEGLEYLPNVAYVNLEDNVITRLDIARSMSRLRCLRVSDNRLEGSLDVRALTNVRILYADRNRITGIIHGEKLKRLETLSLRYQSGKGLDISGRDIRDIRRLYLSGNSLGFRFLNDEQPCYNMIYLELADCQLTSVPSNLGQLIPNVRVLNLNYNFIGEMGGLEELKRLKKLSMIGSRLRGTRGIIRALKRMEEVEMVDFRMNPCTVSWYVPLLDNGEEEWQELDAKFRRGLPDELYAERLVYRGMLMQTCQQLKIVDGLAITDGERSKAIELLRRIEEGQRKRRVNL